METLSLQLFIDKSAKTHKNKYDYTKSVYTNSKTPVEIICPLHGSFFQRPDNHLHGRGCYKCKGILSAEKTRKGLNYFVHKAVEKHGNLYDYSKVHYVNNRTPVTIICRKHGHFIQSPGNHYKYGCEECGREKSGLLQRRKTEEFINLSSTVHNNKYSYSKTEYSHAHKKLTITCPLHGDFEQSPNAHLQGKGCKKCKLGIFHPRYGKPNGSAGYFGRYNGTVFRSLSELFWFLDRTKQDKDCIGIDQDDLRRKWQVTINLSSGKTGTYCPDFFLPKENKVVDIKPKWKWIAESDKWEQAKKAYASRGLRFELIDCDKIAIDFDVFSKLVSSGQVILYPASAKRWAKHRKNRNRCEGERSCRTRTYR